MHSRVDIAEVETELKELEQRILDRLVNTGIELGRDPILASIMAHLHLHGELTQRELQDHTGYSAGPISEALKPYVEKGIIHEHKPKGRGALVYRIDNIPQFTLNVLLSSMDLVLSYEEECRKIQLGLEEMPESVRSERLYVGLKEFISFYFKFIPIYKTLEEIIHKPEKSK